MPDQLLTVDELAAALKVPKSWIYDKPRRGADAIPSLRVGKYIRFRFDAVLVWLEAQQDETV